MNFKNCKNCGDECQYFDGHLVCPTCGTRWKVDMQSLTKRQLSSFTISELHSMNEDMKKLHITNRAIEAIIREFDTTMQKIEALDRQIEVLNQQTEAINRRTEELMEKLNLRKQSKDSAKTPQKPISPVQTSKKPISQTHKMHPLIRLIVTLLIFVPGILLSLLLVNLFTNDSDHKNAIAEIGSFSVGYLTEIDYNNGEYDDSAITQNAIFINGAPQYMVVDFKIKVLADNSGNESIKIMARASDASAMSTMIQDAPTGRIELTESAEGVRSYHLFYQIPAKKMEEKTVRMVLKLIPLNGNDVKFHISALGENDIELKGETFTTHLFHPALSYTLNSDGKSYTVSGVNYNNLSVITIPDTLSGGFPVTGIASNAFAGNTNIRTLVIGNNIKQINTGTFYGCTKLAIVTIPDSVTIIGGRAFSNCKNLREIRYNGTKAQWGKITLGADWDLNTPDYTLIYTKDEKK